MAFLRVPSRTLLALVAAGLMVLAVALFVLWLLSGLAGGKPMPISLGNPTNAVVVKSASCQSSDAYDTVSINVAGHQQQARLNACNNPVGASITVLAPANVSDNTLVQPANVPLGDSSGLWHRIAFVLLTASAAVGGVASYLVHRRLGKSVKSSKVNVAP